MCCPHEFSSLQPWGPHNLALQLTAAVGFAVRAIERHVGVEPEINPSQIVVRQLHLTVVIRIVENLHERTFVGTPTSGSRHDLRDARVAPFVPSHVGTQVLVRTRERSGHVARQHGSGGFATAVVVAAHAVPVKHILHQERVTQRPRTWRTGPDVGRGSLRRKQRTGWGC